MNIIKHETRSLVENVYIVEENKNCFIIDPGYGFEDIKNIIEKNNLNVEFIILTHGHGDHIGSVKELKQLYNVPVYANINEKELLKDSTLNLSEAMYGKISIIADKYLNENSNLSFHKHKIELIDTPGHTEGGMCILIENHLFSGDTLFWHSVGRWDLATGNHEKLLDSINNKLMKLDDKLIVHPGHGRDTTIGEERINNPFINLKS